MFVLELVRPSKSKMDSVNSEPTDDSHEISSNVSNVNAIDLPEELIERILYHTDDDTLSQCRRVCKRWNEIIEHYIWRKKAETKIGCIFSSDTPLEWKDYYLICAKNLFERNLIKPDPNCNLDDIDDSPHSGKSYMLAGAFGINLIEEGFSSNILDYMQPPVEVSLHWTEFDCEIYWIIFGFSDQLGQTTIKGT